jgi:hypothetical protein
MTCAEAVRTHLLTLSPVTTLVNARIWTAKFPQKPTMPAVLVQQIADVHDPHLRGTNDLRYARIQVDVITGDDMPMARAVDQAILGDGASTGLEGAAVTAGSIDIKVAFPIGYREVFEGDELKQARVIRDYRVGYTG